MEKSANATLWTNMHGKKCNSNDFWFTHKLDLIFVSILLRLRLISRLCKECCWFETSLPLELVGDLLGEG